MNKLSDIRKKVLIYRHGSIGDTIMALPSFHKIREHYPDADIVLLTNRPFTVKEAPLEFILGKGYFFNQAVAYPGATRNLMAILRLLIKLWRMRFDVVIDLTVSRTPNRVSRDLLFFKLAGIKEFIGFPMNDEHLQRLTDPETGQIEWEAKRLAKRIAALGPVDLSNSAYWDLRLSDAELKQAEQCLSALTSQPILALSLGTKAESKNWELTNWLALLTKLRHSLSTWNLLVIGSADEAHDADKCLEAWQGAGINLCGKTSARVSAAILKRCTLFVGHDSGPMHLAGCVGTPCVAVFSAQNLPGQWFPRGTKNRILYKQTDCAGCGLTVCIEQKKRCILSITVQDVEAAVLQVAASVSAKTNIVC